MNIRTVSAGLIAVVALASSAWGQQIKISQIFGAGGNTGAAYNRDYVELFNAGASTVNVGGWSVHYASATGTTWAKTDLPAANIPAGGYFLIQMTLTGTNGAALPTPDHVVGTAIAMAATAGKVALTSNNTALSGACPTGGAIVDFVGFGATANCFEGTGPTPAPATTGAVFRDMAGCEDTGENDDDFTADAPAPRNSATAVNLCPQPPGADVAVTITDNASQVALGANTTYTITARNFGPDPATVVGSATWSDTNGTYVSQTGGFTPAAPGVVVDLTGVVLAAGGEHVYTLTLTAAGGASLQVAAGATGIFSPPPDPVPGNNSAIDTDLIYDQTRATVLIGVDTPSLPVLVVDVESGATETLFNAEVAGIATDDANRTIYFSTGTELWRAPYDPPRTPVLIGSFNGPITTLSGGLVYDSTRGKLLGSTTSSFYEINPQTAEATLVRAVGAGDFQGLDYDPVTDRLICTNDSTSTSNGLAGRGLYRVDPNGTETTLLSVYPIKTGVTLDTDIDGCAYSPVGTGTIYPVADEMLWFYRYDVAGATYQSPHATPYGADQGASGASYTPYLFVPPSGANIQVAFSSVPADCVTLQGSNFTYELTIRNLGPSTANMVDLSTTFPAGTTFISSTPPLVPVGNMLTLPVGSLTTGSTQTLSVTLTADVGGVLALSGAGTTSSSDPFLVNNGATHDLRVLSAPPVVNPPAKGVFSTVAGTNSVPGMPGVSFSGAVDMGRIYASANGRWIMSVDTDFSDATMDRVLVRGDASTFDVVAQEGVSVLSTFETIGNFDSVAGINDSGNFSFSTTLTPGSLKAVVKGVGGTMSFVARQTDVAAIAGSTYGTTMGSATIQNDNTVSFYSSLVGLTTTTDTALFTDDGTSVIAQEGVTIPGMQTGGAMETYQAFDTGATLGLGFFPRADGASYSARADLNGATTVDLVNVIGGDVMIQEGVALPPFVETVSAINHNQMTPSGNWYAYGSNATSAQDWAVRNGTVVARTDDPIYTGATELFDDAQFAQTFFVATGNGVGDYIVGGLTNGPDNNANAVLVMNNTQVVLRENDPVDLNNNGLFDDDAYVHIFRDDSVVLTDDRVLYVTVRLRNNAGLCSGAPDETGQALIKVNLVTTGACCTGSICVVTTSALCTGPNTAFTSLGTVCTPFSVVTPCCRADFNHSGGAPTSQDIFDFLAAFFSPNPLIRAQADFNESGLVSSQDIFDFLAAFFRPGGCNP